jgi:uroporphyrin-III C-methyltransferase/precorrin-2 dehydrogenase/sirohydrochlorin ferrochelatase
MCFEEAVMKSLFPVLLDIKDKSCVVVGGGEVALRKAGALVERGAAVRVVSPELHPELKEMADKNQVRWERRKYEPGDLEGSLLCVAAADDPAVNAEVRREANERRALVNVVDDPESSDYQVPSFYEDGPLLIAVSTSGASPAVSRTLRRMLQSWLGESFGRAVDLIKDFREQVVKKQIVDSRDRVRFWESAITSEALDKAREGDLGGLKRMLERSLENFK